MKLKVMSIVLFASVLLNGCTNASASGKNKKSEQTDQKTENMSKTINLTQADFLTKVANFEKNPNEWVYLGDKPAIIDFYADWCGPCKMIAPILEELAAEYENKIYVYKIDTEAEQMLAATFGIRSIPTLLFVPKIRCSISSFRCNGWSLCP